MTRLLSASVYDIYSLVTDMFYIKEDDYKIINDLCNNFHCINSLDDIDNIKFIWCDDDIKKLITIIAPYIIGLDGVEHCGDDINYIIEWSIKFILKKLYCDDITKQNNDFITYDNLHCRVIELDDSLVDNVLDTYQIY